VTEVQTSSDVQPFRMQSGFKLANTAPEKCPCLVEGLLLEVGVSMLCAKPKCGKTSLALQLAVCVAEGRSFLGKPTVKGNVLYLILEGPKGVIQHRLNKLGLTDQHGKVFVVYEQMPFKGELGLQRLEKTIKAIPDLRLVVVDPVSKLLRIADSDSYDEVTLAIERLEALAKKYSLHLMFLTHGKKKQTDDAGDSPIGSTSFRGGTDTNIFLSKVGVQRTVSTEQRWGVSMEPTLMLWDENSETLGLGNTVEQEETAKHQNRERRTLERIQQDILTELGNRPNLTQMELLAAVSGKTTTKLSVLEELEASGRLIAETNGKPFRYRLAEIPVEKTA
jgi:hypothetical protein